MASLSAVRIGTDMNRTLAAGLLAVAFGGAAPLAVAQPVELSALNGTNGFRVDGFDAGGAAGASASGVGEANVRRRARALAV